MAEKESGLHGKDQQLSGESSSTSSTSANSNIPRVIKFAYGDFSDVSGKWSAKCLKCKKRLQDKAGVTTSFTKYATRFLVYSTVNFNAVHERKHVF